LGRLSKFGDQDLHLGDQERNDGIQERKGRHWRVLSFGGLVGSCWEIEALAERGVLVTVLGWDGSRSRGLACPTHGCACSSIWRARQAGEEQESGALPGSLFEVLFLLGYCTFYCARVVWRVALRLVSRVWRGGGRDRCARWARTRRRSRRSRAAFWQCTQSDYLGWGKYRRYGGSGWRGCWDRGGRAAAAAHVRSRGTSQSGEGADGLLRGGETVAAGTSAELNR